MRHDHVHTMALRVRPQQCFHWRTLLQPLSLPARCRYFARTSISHTNLSPKQVQLPDQPPPEHGLVTKIVLRIAPFLGYNAPRQVSQRKIYALYHQVIKGLYAKDESFWQNSKSSVFFSLPGADLNIQAAVFPQPSRLGSLPPTSISGC